MLILTQTSQTLIHPSKSFQSLTAKWVSAPRISWFIKCWAPAAICSNKCTNWMAFNAQRCSNHRKSCQNFYGFPMSQSLDCSASTISPNCREAPQASWDQTCHVPVGCRCSWHAMNPRSLVCVCIIQASFQDTNVSARSDKIWKIPLTSRNINSSGPGMSRGMSCFHVAPPTLWLFAAPLLLLSKRK